jgi:recombinational DNA repair protein RecR
VKSNTGPMWAGMPPPNVGVQQDVQAKLNKLEQDIVELKQLVQRLVPPAMPVNPTTWRRGCTICGMTTESAMGYVCSNPSCPVRITSTRIVTQPSTYIDLDREQA